MKTYVTRPLTLTVRLPVTICDGCGASFEPTAADLRVLARGAAGEWAADESATTGMSRVAIAAKDLDICACCAAAGLYAGRRHLTTDTMPEAFAALTAAPQAPPAAKPDESPPAPPAPKRPTRRANAKPDATSENGKAAMPPDSSGSVPTGNPTTPVV